MIRITVYQDGKAVNEVAKTDTGGEITIGRAPGCFIRLEEAAISRLHCLIRYNQDAWLIERRANFGVIKVNGQEIENAPLQGGEEIEIGSFVLRIQIEASEPVVAESATSTSQLISSEEGRTRVLNTGSSQGIFRFEAGTANLAEFIVAGESAVFGRASNCDVVLLDKKASRKHLEIRREGLSFFIKDLNSANGTLLNERKLEGEAELVPGDILQVGESKFQFSIENKEFFAKQGEFLPVPQDLQEQSLGEPMAETALSYQEQQADAATEGAAAVETEQEKSLFKRLWKKYLSLPPVHRYAVILVTLLLSVTFLKEDEKPETKPKVQVKRDAEGRIIRTFESLSEDKKDFVRKNYKELVDAQQKREYSRMLDLITKINAVVDEYRDLKAYETIAKRGIADEEAREKVRVAQERQEALRREISVLEEKGKVVFQRALHDASARPELTATIQEIYTKDPNNRLAQEWSQAIKDKDVEDEKLKELAKQRALLKDKAERELLAVKAIFKADRYKEALAASEKLFDIGYGEDKFEQRVESLQNEIRDKLASILEPLLKDAEVQRAEGGDLVKANEIFVQVLKIDPQNKQAMKGLESIRETLHIRARRLYALAVLAESISDLSEAKDKFTRCFRTAPDEDIYKERCRSKLARFEAFQGSGGSN